MAGRIKQHPDVFLGLELSKDRAHLHGPDRTCSEVRHRDVEVGLDLLLADRTWPGRSNVVRFILEVQPRTGRPGRWSDLSPAILRRMSRPGRLRSGDGPLE